MKLNEFENNITEKIVTAVYFSHDECNICKVLKPKVINLVDKYDDFGFIYVNTKESPDICGQHTVFTVPTVLVFVEGKESKRFSRNFAMRELEELLDRYEQMIG
ncbi:MAG: thioredoxin family protein [Candidatus Delongbacteria bacterium]|jgi:thioredoxin 1|nr:thioredoxin family protein [Candidatus Delongbacteria bacterium]